MQCGRVAAENKHVSVPAGRMRESWNLYTISSSGRRTSGRFMVLLRHAHMRGTRKADSAGEPRIPDVYST